MVTVTINQYTGKIEEIYQENPDYKTGGDGSGGVCDCIGMCRGALERAGATNIHNMRGVNNAVRHVEMNLQPLTQPQEASMT